MLKGSVGILMVVLLVASVFVPVEIPYTFNSTAMVDPLQEWVLHKNVDGNLIKTLHNYKTGQLVEYATFPFDRGDVVNIKFDPNNIDASKVDSGYLVASITSLFLGQQLVDLQSEINIEKANLLKVSTGEKPEIVIRNQEKLNQARQDLDFQQSILDRAQKMFDDGLISKVKLEAAEAAVKQAHITIELAKKQINVTSTGEKPEEVNLIRTKIESLQAQINFLQGTNDSYEIYTPISGDISYETGIDGDKLIIEDVTEYILKIPIKVKDRNFIGNESVIELDVMGSDTLVQAQLISINNKVEILNGEAVVLAKASMRGDIEGLSSGMPIRCKITTGKVLPIEYMKRSIKIESK